MIRHWLRRERAQGLVEFAVVFPLLAFFLIAIFDGALGFQRQATLQHAVREGARYAALRNNADSGDFVRARTSQQAQNLVPATEPPLGGGNGVHLCYEDLNGDGTYGVGDAVNVIAQYQYKPRTGLFDSIIGSIDMAPTGSSRLEVSLTSQPTGSAICP
jgi:hypothetical protein